MKFLADNMLGKLAKYLRLMGYDTSDPPPGNSSELIRIARQENRTILTRNTHLSAKHSFERILFIKSQRFPEQLRQVINTYNLKVPKNKLFTRCLRCNQLLEPISKQAVQERLPLKVQQHFRSFKYCPRCDKVYWRGGHTRRMQKKLYRILRSQNKSADNREE